MRELEWFINTLEKEYQVNVERETISFEGNELYLDEIDDSLIPSNMMDGLPEPLLFETMVYEDSQGTEWLGIIGLDLDSRQWYLQVIIKGGVPVLRKRMERE